MRVLICPDAFKGSLSASRAAAAIAAGIHHAWPEAVCHCLPLADGGEGTAAVIAQAWAANWETTEVRSPLGAPIAAGWGWDAVERRAVIEVASACGITLTPADARRPWLMDTRGVGMLLQAVVARGAQSVWVGLGGSGTNDVGAGMLHALGLRFIDRQGQPLSPTPAALGDAVALDWSGLPTGLRQIQWQVLTDVDAQLSGEQGATRRFGPQKGVRDNELTTLDERVAQIGRLMAPMAEPACGDGAAGGLGFAFRTVLGAQLVSGSQQVASLLGLTTAMAAADLVVTGEGRFDESSLQGKVVAAVCQHAAVAGKPLWILAGQVDELAARPLQDTGVRVAGIVPSIAAEREALAAPEMNLTALAAAVCRGGLN